MISLLVLVVIVIFLASYLFYGRFLFKQMRLDDSRPTPACRLNDGVDFVPAKPALLLGQHFSAISAAGPIVGPILACIWFGWLPAVLWIIIGAVFIGGVHDFLSLVASIRHKAASIGEIVKHHMSRTSHILFLIFVWFALIYVIIAFTEQLLKESNALPVGYGAMLLEGLVAVLALATVIMIPKGADILKTDPNLIYANGIASYLGLMGVGFSIAFPFALLVFSTFVYDTLDVCTRLARYIFQELTGWETRIGGFFAALISLVIPFAFLTLTQEKGYLVAWPIFGTSNQLLASLILLAISMWLIRSGKNALYSILPMIFMLGMTLWSLILLILPFLKSLSDLFSGIAIKSDTVISGICGIILFILSVLLIFEAIRVLVLKPVKDKKA